MASTSSLPHTLDNLCRQEKDKVQEMLRQLNELRKRCTSLEREIESKRSENQRLTGREDILTSQLEAVQSKLLSVVEISKDAQGQVEQLSLKLQKTETKKKTLQAEYRESQIEAQRLQEKMAELQSKHLRTTISIGLQCGAPTCDRSSNTESSAISLHSAAVQVPAEGTFTEPVTANISHLQVMSPDRKEPVSHVEECCADGGVEADSELLQLICMLNQF
jgi:uncharacterized phage infection (PIP) family protein YhgE